MAVPDPSAPRALAPVASIWCRQVDHEAESPGYTAIPDEFPGRRETLEAVRLVGHLTVNVADTHDYWDPDPSSTLSYYPNLFVYPAASGRYTCVGRMFLSTEDRPRLGMKTLVFSTQDLIDSGAFGEMVLRALATLDGRGPERPRPAAEPDPSVYQAVGEGFLFHRGSTEPVVVVASEQWEAACQAVGEVIRSMPASLVSLGAFLVFPYFLPAAKIDLRQFTEEIPLALAVMRVPRQESEGERHAKRMQSWENLPVNLRDLTRGPATKARESLPLVLQYVRDHADGREFEVARRVDQVEIPRLAGHLNDPDRQLGKDRRREMWRIGTAMETAALLLSRPKGRTVKVSAETQKRANQYLDAKPAEAPLLAPPPAPAEAGAAAPTPSRPAPASPPRIDLLPPPIVPGPAPSGPTTVPSWLRPSAGIAPVPQDPATVPVPTGLDPSVQRASAPLAPASPTTPPPVPSVSPAASRPPPLAPPVSLRPVAAAPAPAPPSLDVATVDLRVARALVEAERRWNEQTDARLRALTASSDQTVRAAVEGLGKRIETLEQRPVPAPGPSANEVEGRLKAWTDLRLLETDRRIDQSVVEPLVALAQRIEALESRPLPTAEAIGAAVEGRLRADSDRRFSDTDRKAGELVAASTEAWAGRIRRELQQAVDEIAARAGKSEEELRTSLAAQIDVEVLEAKEQGAALREELEGRLRELLDNRVGGADRQRAQEARELEQRVALLVEGRFKESEQRLSTTLAQNSDRLTAATDDRISHVERRLSAERDARLAEFTEAHRAALGALQTRLQNYLEQKLRDARAEEEQRAVVVTTRLRSELDQSIDRKLTSPAVEAGLDARIAQALEVERTAQAGRLSQAIGDAEARIGRAREEALGHLSELQQRLQSREAEIASEGEAIRAELDDLDRRLAVVNDHVLPLVRQTWLKVSEQEFAARAKVTESRLAAVRQELSEEVRRVEAELLQQQSDLRDRLEASVASNGRIWLNLLRQLSPDGGGGMPSAASPPSHRFARRPRSPNPAVPTPAETAALPADATPFASDPPNPMDPELGRELESKEPRRRLRRP